MIWRGNVGSALQRGLAQAGYEAHAVGNDPPRVRGVADRADVIILAVPFGQIGNALREMGDAVNGKAFVDVTNALTPDYDLAVGRTTSGAKELQRKAPDARGREGA